MNTLKNAVVTARRQAILASILAKTAVDWFGAERRQRGVCGPLRDGRRPLLQIGASGKSRSGPRGAPVIPERFDD